MAKSQLIAGPIYGWKTGGRVIDKLSRHCQREGPFIRNFIHILVIFRSPIIDSVYALHFVQVIVVVVVVSFFAPWSI